MSKSTEGNEKDPRTNGSDWRNYDIFLKIVQRLSHKELYIPTNDAGGNANFVEPDNWTDLVLQGLHIVHQTFRISANYCSDFVLFPSKLV